MKAEQSCLAEKSADVNFIFERSAFEQVIDQSAAHFRCDGCAFGAQTIENMKLRLLGVAAEEWARICSAGAQAGKVLHDCDLVLVANEAGEAVK